MAQRTSNIYRLVTIPAVYKMIQKVLGAEQSSRRFVDEVVRPTRGAAVLDVGCGPASLLPYLPSIDYTGVDLNPASIAFAKKNYAERGRFLVGDAADLVPDQRFDIVILAALLHHLDDAGAKRLFGNLVGALKPGGRIVTIDNIWLPRQNQSPSSSMRSIQARTSGRWRATRSWPRGCRCESSTSFIATCSASPTIMSA